MESKLTTVIESARIAAGLSQRALAERIEISYPTLNRILNGERAAKMPEIIQLADALGCTVGQLTGSAVSERVQFAARATNGSSMSTMRQRLMHFIEMDAYLDDQGIPVK